MPIGRYRFRPRLWPTVVTLLLLPMLLSLGVWQLDRAAQKREILHRVETAANQAPRRLSKPLPAFDTIRLRTVRVQGRFDSRHQFLLDNQIREGRAGYRVLTPLRLGGSDVAVLVERGWRSMGPDRGRLPDVDAPAGGQRVSGLATLGPSVGIRLGAAYVGDGSWPRRIQYLDFDVLDDAVPYKLAHFIVEPGVSVEERVGTATNGVGPARHTGYAVQWFALAAALLVIYVAVNLKRGGEDDG